MGSGLQTSVGSSASESSQDSFEIASSSTPVVDFSEYLTDTVEFFQGDVSPKLMSEKDMVKKAFAASVRRNRSNAESWYVMRKEEIDGQRRLNHAHTYIQSEPLTSIPGTTMEK